MNREWGGFFFLSPLLELVGFRVLLNPPTAFIFVPQHARLSALKSTLLYWPTNLTTNFSLSATSRITVLSSFPLSDSVERECSSASPWYFPGFLKTYEQRQKWMVSSVSSHRLCHKATFLLDVQSSGNTRKGFLTCFLITNHHISAAAKGNKKWGGWAENKIFLPPTPPPPPPNKQSNAASVFLLRRLQH